jgi:squalene-hopene/tetraprenyl-beta-curcumene cyclase
MFRSLTALALFAAAPGPAEEYNPGRIRPDEPTRKEASIPMARKYLDHASLAWTTKRECATCHTNVPHLMASAALGPATEAEKKVRAFFEQRVAGWKREKGKRKPHSDADTVTVAAALSFHDAGRGGKLSEVTRRALDRIWETQEASGAWEWIKCEWPPLEHDDYYGAVLAALAVGHAPGDYTSTEKAKAGLAKLRAYFQKTPPPSLHHQALLLWASTKLDGLMSKDERAATVKKLCEAQKRDGGWSLPTLGEWKGYDGRDNDISAPSDGYATGVTVFVLRQAGVARDDPAVNRGAGWLRANQRESGRWFTQSLNTDNYHYISNAGTAFAVLALKACE